MDQTRPSHAQDVLPESGKRPSSWAEYNHRKLTWLLEHKDATPAEIDAACTRIAAELGL